MARECVVLRHAVDLAGWVGDGRAVTAKEVLRRADVAAAAGPLGVEVPEWVRSAADVPALHRPWTAAIGAGWLSVEGGRAVRTPTLAGWPSADRDEVLDRWSRGFAATLADTFEDGAEALEIGRLALTVLAAEPVPTGADLVRAIGHVVAASGLYRTFDRWLGLRDPAETTLELLAAFGAVARAAGQWRVTPLGRWALSVISVDGVSLLGSSDDATEGAYQLKITLRYVRPACWRRVLMPASAAGRVARGHPDPLRLGR